MNTHRDISSLEKQIAECDRQLATLTEALEYYANPKLYVALVKEYKDGHYDLDCELLFEGGKRAATALKAAEANHDN